MNCICCPTCNKSLDDWCKYIKYVLHIPGIFFIGFQPMGGWEFEQGSELLLPLQRLHVCRQVLRSISIKYLVKIERACTIESSLDR